MLYGANTMRSQIGLKATLAMSSIYFCTHNVAMYFIEKYLREKNLIITMPQIILFSTMISFTTVLIFLIGAKLKHGDMVQIRFATTGLLITAEYDLYEDYDDEEMQKKKQLVTEEDILKLPEIEYKSSRDGGNVHVQGGKDGKDSSSIRCHYNDSCSICIENYQCKERVRVLPCGHLFHTDCIVPWLSQRSSCCPICKEPVRKETRESTKEV